MNYKKLIFSFMSFGLLMCLAGCAKKRNYKPNKLLSLKESAHVDYQETKEQITVRAKAFSKIDCDYIFGERADRIIGEKDPLQPIQLCIENNGSNNLKLLESKIDLQLVSAKEVTRRLGTSSNYLASGIWGGIGLSGIVSGIVSTSVIASSAVCPCAFLLPVMLISVGCLVAMTSPFVFLIENWSLSAENCRVSNYINTTSPGKKIAINPGQVIDVIIFVKQNEYRSTFKCTLMNDETGKEISFIIKLNEAH